MNCVEWWDSVFLLVLLSLVTSVSCLDAVGVATEENLLCCNFHSLCNKSSEAVKGILKYKLYRVQTLICKNLNQ